jgi:hypothetical protein
MTRLPVWVTVKAAYGAVWANLRLLLRFAVVPFVLFLVVPPLAIQLARPLLMGWFEVPDWSGASPAGGEWSWLWFFVPTYAASFLGFALLVPFAVQCYRLFLLGPGAVAADGWYRVGRESLGMLGVFALSFLATAVLWPLLAMLVMPPAMSVLFPGPEVHDCLPICDPPSMFDALTVAAGLLALWILVYIADRLLFLLPVICLRRPWALAARWRETRGNAGRLFLCLLLALCPLLLLGLDEGFTIDDGRITVGFPQLWPVPLGFEGPAFDWLRLPALIGVALEGVLQLLTELLWAAVTVTAFALLSGTPARGVRLPAT